MFVLRLKRGEENRLAKAYKWTPAKVQIIATYCLQQTKERFATGGVSGGMPWPQKFLRSVGYDDGRAILTGATGELLNSFIGYGEDNRAIMASNSPYALIHQLGTVGKGGVLPTIVPKRAKALFIPITDKAINSMRISGPRAALLRTGQNGGVRLSESPLRVHVSSIGYKPGKSLGMEMYSPLIKGRIKNGALERLDPAIGKYLPGIPDFIFLSKSDIPPRPMLPDGATEQENQRRLIASMFGPPRNSGGNATLIATP